MDLTVECFLLAFRRFASRRSLPKLMLSDNASTYLATAEELQNLFSSAVAENLSRQGFSGVSSQNRPLGSKAFGEDL